MRRVLPVVLFLLFGCSKAGDGAKPSENAVPASSSRVQDARVQGASDRPAAVLPGPSASAPARAKCGASVDEPRCALQREMATMTASLEKKEWILLAEQLDLLSKNSGTAPFPNWVSIARDTRDAARSAEVDGVHAGCRSCHEQYKELWSQRMRGTADDPPSAPLEDAGVDGAAPRGLPR